MGELIEISGVSRTYRGGEAPALDGVSLSVAQGTILGLLGPNGAGKTTLLSVLLGLQRMDAGTITLAGLDVTRDRRSVRRLCGLAPQELGFYPMLTVAENLDFYAGAGGLAGPERERRIAFAAGTAQLSEHLRQRAERLSGGLKRRLNLALSLLHSPRVLFLDEPTVGVDPQSRAFILEVVRRLRDEQGTTVIYTSHYMEEVQLICDRVAILDHGRVLAHGSLRELLDRGRALTLLLPQAPSAAALAEIGGAFPAARCVRAELRIETGDPLGALETLRPLLARLGLAPAGIHYGHRNLEELFLELTHRRLRD